MGPPSTGTTTEPARGAVPAALRQALKLSLMAGAAWMILITCLLVWPPPSALGHADAIVVLSGDHGERFSRARELLARNVAPTLIMAGEPDTASSIRICAGGQPFEVICLRPHPDSTAAEARAVAALSSARHWRALVVVTTTDHVLRAGIRFRRCFHGTLAVEGAGLHAGAIIQLQAMAHELLGNMDAATLDRGC